MNRTRKLAFDGSFVKAELVEEVRNLAVTGVVTNLSGQPMVIDGSLPTVIPPWKSTILKNGTIKSAERVSVVNVPDDTNLGGVVFDGWDWFGNQMAEFPRTTPLYISAKDVVGHVELNPWRFSNNPEPREETASYDVQLNLWWAPAKTDAVVHNTHQFLEIHTQIFGHGRIQIYEDEAGRELYREISTAPGDTHDPIVSVLGASEFRYPWHRGWTDTDAIWMAIELHPRS